MAKQETAEVEVEANAQVGELPIEWADVEALKPHPQNYKIHPDEQLEHIMQSIQEHGLYRNIVVARDYTILAGHGVVLAAQRLGRTSVPVVRVDLEPHHPRALKLLAGDNEMMHLGVVDDQALAAILQTIRDEDETSLLGTGYDSSTLDQLIAVSGLGGHEVEGHPDDEWVGLPAYENKEAFGAVASIKVHFATEDDLQRFAEMVEQNLNVKTKFIWYPYKEPADLKAINYVHQDES